MNILECIKIAIKNISSNKMRTILTTLGIIIGISSVITIVAIGKGFKNKIDKEFSSINANVVSLYISGEEANNNKYKLTLKDMEALEKLDNVKTASPNYLTHATINSVNGNKALNYFAYLNASDENGEDLHKLKMKYGRFIAREESKNGLDVVVISDTLSKSIFGNENSVGQKIEVSSYEKNKMKLEIIGVFETGVDDFSSNSIYSPLQNALELDDQNEENFSSAKVEIENSKTFSRTQKEIIRTLSIIHKAKDDIYELSANFEILDTMGTTIDIFTTFISFVASIALLVGGIGVMNIMLVTVTERTREIGVRKALGASEKSIQLQFLVEAVFVSMIGGIFGIIFGYLGQFIVGIALKAMGQNLVPQVSIKVLIGSVLISTIIGVVFGVYPARKASKLDPIEALRYE